MPKLAWMSAGSGFTERQRLPSKSAAEDTARQVEYGGAKRPYAWPDEIGA